MRHLVHLPASHHIHRTAASRALAAQRCYWPHLVPRLVLPLATLPPTYPSPPPPCHDPTVHRTVFDPRGELLIAATAHGTVSLWDVDALRDAAHTTSPPPPLLCLHTGVRLSDAAWDPVQDTRIAVASHSCADVFVFDLERCKVGFCTCLTCCVHDHLSQSAPTSVFKSPALAAATMLGHSRTGRFTLAATGVAAGGQVGHSSVARDVHQ